MGREPDPAAQWQVLRDEATGAAMSCPSSWVHVEVPPGTAVISVAAPAPSGGGEQFRPNVILTVERVPPDAVDLRVLCPAVVEGLLRALPLAHVMAVDLYPFRDDLDGRRITVVHRQPPHAVVLTQYLALVDDVATAVSASCTVEQSLTWARPFEGFLRGFDPADRKREGTRDQPR